MTSRPAPEPETGPEGDGDDPLEPAQPDEQGADARSDTDERVHADARGDADTRPGLERILPELLRRGFEVGRGPLERVSESFFPRDIASHLVSQLGDVRSGVVKAVAHEVGRFLREADIASEVRKVLTGIDVEATVKLRFSAREGGAIKPEVEIQGEGDGSDKPRDRRKK